MKHLVAKVCPRCGGVEYTRKRSESFVAFGSDRECNACGRRYTPPTPAWAGVLFVVIGIALAAFGAIAVILHLTMADPVGLPATACEGFLGFLGLMAVGHGVRVLIRPGRV